MKRLLVASFVLTLLLSIAIVIIYRHQAQPFTVFDQPEISAPCVRAGCSGQLCLPADQASNINTTCEFESEYQCYQQANCRLDRRGKCSFNITPEIETCLRQAHSSPNR